MSKFPPDGYGQCGNNPFLTSAPPLDRVSCEFSMSQYSHSHEGARPAYPPVLLACWQGDYPQLRKLLKEKNALASGAPSVESALLEVGSVPRCLTSRPRSCPHTGSARMPAAAPQSRHPGPLNDRRPGTFVEGDYECWRSPGADCLATVMLAEQNTTNPSGPTEPLTGRGRLMRSPHSRRGELPTPRVSNMPAATAELGTPPERPVLAASLRNQFLSALEAPLNPAPRPLEGTQGVEQKRGESWHERGTRTAECFPRQAVSGSWGAPSLPDTRLPAPVGGVPAPVPTQQCVDACPQETGTPLELAVRSKSLSCANLILAVLLVRKFLALNLLASSDSLVRRLWNSDPQEVMLEAIYKLDDSAHSFVHFFSRLPRTMRTSVVSCLLQQAPAVSGLGFTPLQTKSPDLRDNLLAVLLAGAILSGEGSTARQIPDQRSLSLHVCARACCHALRLARVLHLNFSQMLPSLESLFQPKRSDDPLVRFLLGFHVMVAEVCSVRSLPPRSSRQESRKRITEALAEIFCREVGFIFDIGRIRDTPVFHPRSRAQLCLKFLVTWRRRSKLPRPFRVQCQVVFRDLCRRGAAGWFLMALEHPGALWAFKPLPRQRLVLSLLQYVRATEKHFPRGFRACRLCEKPILSFLVWSARQPVALLPDLPYIEIGSYCRAEDLALLSLLLQQQPPSRMRLCHHHERELAATMVVFPGLAQAVLKWKTMWTLKTLSLLAVLDGLHGNCESLWDMVMPGGLRKYFYLEEEIVQS